MRLKDLVSINQRTLPETTQPDYAFRYVEISSVDSNGTIQNLEEMTFDSAPSRARRLVKRDDVIVSTVRTYLRAIGAIDFEATDVVVSTGFAVCTPNEKVVPKYLNYALRCDNVMDEICKDSSGISYPAINATKLSSIEIPYLDIPLQQAIVAYLDEKAAAIDRKVALLEKKLAAFKRLKTSIINRAVTRGLDPHVKLKDSGVDWIGQVPEGWEVRRFSREFTFFKGMPITKADLTETGVAVISYGQIHSKDNPSTTLLPSLLRCVPEKIVAENLSARLNYGDIVFADTSEDIEGCGNCVLMDFEGEVFAGYHDIVARPNQPESAKYYAYLFNSPSWRMQIRARVAGIKVFSMTQRLFKGVSVIFPSVSEQREIAAYLDAECAKIDKAAAIAEKQIDAYRRLKRSLINEVVTGKRKVA